MEGQLIESFRSTLRHVPKGGDLLVGFSGGKDSLTIMDLVVRVGYRPVPYFMWLVPGLEIVEVTLRWAERQYGVEVIRIPHWALSDHLRMGKFSPPRNRGQVRTMKVLEVEQALRHRTGVDWFVYGHRRDESLERRGMLSKVDGSDEKSRRAYPIWKWSTKAVLRYLHMRKIPIPPIYRQFGTSARATGINLRATTLVWMKKNHPDDYKRVQKMFPFVEAAVFREEMLASSGSAAVPDEPET